VQNARDWLTSKTTWPCPFHSLPLHVWQLMVALVRNRTSHVSPGLRQTTHTCDTSLETAIKLLPFDIIRNIQRNCRYLIVFNFLHVNIEQLWWQTWIGSVSMERQWLHKSWQLDCFDVQLICNNHSAFYTPFRMCILLSAFYRYSCCSLQMSSLSTSSSPPVKKARLETSTNCHSHNADNLVCLSTVFSRVLIFVALSYPVSQSTSPVTLLWYQLSCLGSLQGLQMRLG